MYVDIDPLVTWRVGHLTGGGGGGKGWECIITGLSKLVIIDHADRV